jgi:hypothetical protein
MTYTEALNALADAIRALPATTPHRDDMVAMIPRLVPGEWVTAEYPLTALLAKACKPTTKWVLGEPVVRDTPERRALNDVAAAIGNVRGAAWARYGTEYV